MPVDLRAASSKGPWVGKKETEETPPFCLADGGTTVASRRWVRKLVFFLVPDQLVIPILRFPRPTVYSVLGQPPQVDIGCPGQR